MTAYLPHNFADRLRVISNEGRESPPAKLPGEPGERQAAGKQAGRQAARQPARQTGNQASRQAGKQAGRKREAAGRG